MMPKPEPPQNHTPRMNERGDKVTVRVACDPTPVLVVSTYPKRFEVCGQHDEYILPAIASLADGSPDWENGWTACYVGPIPEVFDQGEGNRQVLYTFTAMEVAKDTFSRAEYIMRGVFIAAGEQPTAEELEKARRTRDNYLRGKLEAGHAAFSVRHNPQDVPTEAKLAAQRFNETVPWQPGGYSQTAAPHAAAPLVDIAEHRAPCPMCKEPVIVGAIKCRWCGELIDGSPALLTPSPAPEKKGR